MQAIRTYLNSSTLKQLAPIWSPQLLRMSAIVLDRDSKGRLSAFGRVSFVTFLWRNKEKFSIRSNTCVCHCCVSPTGYCALELRLYINLSVHCKLIAPIKTLAPLSSLHRYGHRSYSECRQLSWTWIPKGGLSVSAQSRCDNACTKSLLYVTIRATAITTRNGVRSLLKKLFFGETKKSFQFAPTLMPIVSASARPDTAHAS